MKTRQDVLKEWGVPPGYEIAYLGNGAVVPIAPNGSIIKGDAYHGFFLKEAVKICQEHASEKSNGYGI